MKAAYADGGMVVRRDYRLLWAAALLMLGGCAKEPPAAEPVPASEVTVESATWAYVGDEACASCHGDIYVSYHRTGMGQSVSRFDPTTAPEQFANKPVVYDPGSDYYYEPFVRGDTLYQREYRLDDAGDVIHERIHAAEWVVGSGNATRSYLMNVNGYVSEMPLTWYVERAIWDLSPGYEQKNQRFSRPIVQECMTCHNGLPEHSVFTPDHYTEVPLGITCERCHGPGEAHVERYLEGVDDTENEVDTRIVNPADLSRDLQLSVCQQCHLTGTTVFKPGEDATTYRPGQPLEANRSVFVSAEQRDDPDRFGIASHAERLALSACYQESAMTCTTCHDPHQPVAEQGIDYFNQTCQTCHSTGVDVALAEPHLCSRDEAASPAEAMTGNCVSCHMQKSGTSDIPHVTFTDHWIRRTLPTARRPDEIERELVRTTPFRLVRMTAPLADSATALAEEAAAYFHLYDTEHRLPDYLPQITQKARAGLTGGAEYAAVRLALGRALIEQDSLEAAATVLREAAARYPEHAEIRYWLGRTELDRGQAGAALAPLEEAVALQPAYVDAWVQLAEAQEALGRVAEAELSYRNALDRDPVHHPAAWNNLGFLYLQSERLDEAARAFDRAIALDPDLTTAFVNAGTVRLLTNDLDEAIRLFERALDTDPNSVPALGNLGIAYAQQERYAEARAVFERLLQLQPGDARVRAMLEEVKARTTTED